MLVLRRKARVLFGMSRLDALSRLVQPISTWALYGLWLHNIVVRGDTREDRYIWHSGTVYTFALQLSP